MLEVYGAALGTRPAWPAAARFEGEDARERKGTHYDACPRRDGARVRSRRTRCISKRQHRQQRNPRDLRYGREAMPLLGEREPSFQARRDDRPAGSSAASWRRRPSRPAPSLGSGVDAERPMRSPAPGRRRRRHANARPHGAPQARQVQDHRPRCGGRRDRSDRVNARRRRKKAVVDGAGQEADQPGMGPGTRAEDAQRYARIERLRVAESESRRREPSDAQEYYGQSEQRCGLRPRREASGLFCHRARRRVRAPRAKASACAPPQTTASGCRRRLVRRRRTRRRARRGGRAHPPRRRRGSGRSLGAAPAL